jgi:hypothetical protein
MFQIRSSHVYTKSITGNSSETKTNTISETKTPRPTGQTVKTSVYAAEDYY